MAATKEEVQAALVAKHGEQVMHSLNSNELIDRMENGDNRDEMGRWLPGCSPKGAGRPVNARNKLSEAFLQDLHETWLTVTQGGASTLGLDVIQAVARDDPSKLLSAMVQVLPKDFQINVTDEQTRWVINAQPALSVDEWSNKYLSQPTDIPNDTE